MEMYLQEPAPQNIVAVEESMIVPLHTSSGEFLERPLVAVVDLLNRDENGLVVTEFKTSGRRFSDLFRRLRRLGPRLRLRRRLRLAGRRAVEFEPTRRGTAWL